MSIKYYLFLIVLGFIACGEMEPMEIVEEEPPWFCDVIKNIPRMKNDSMFYVKGIRNNESWCPKGYSLRYRYVDGYHVVPLKMFDWKECDWFIIIETSGHPDAIQLLPGDTIFLPPDAIGAIYFPKDSARYYGLIDLPKGFDNYITLHSISEDTIIEGSFQIDMPAVDGFNDRMTIKEGKFRLKPTNVQ